jgi:hypothetical protein
MTRKVAAAAEATRAETEQAETRSKWVPVIVPGPTAYG